ncbi:MAG: hydrolase [Prolixibacteraceae bacterium]|nr:hydrolase [Prolixibacteraceae bacterium]
MRIEKQKTIAVMIDIQERLFPAMAGKEKLLDHALKLLKGLVSLKVPVLVTEQYTKGLGQTLPELSACIPDFLPIEKRSFSCYDSPAFVEALEEEDAPNIILFGIESHVCLLQTAIDLKGAGYLPVVVADCTTSRKESDWKLALERFRYEGILISSYESILFELTRSSESEHFRSISQIVK